MKKAADVIPFHTQRETCGEEHFRASLTFTAFSPSPGLRPLLERKEKQDSREKKVKPTIGLVIFTAAAGAQPGPYDSDGWSRSVEVESFDALICWSPLWRDSRL